MHVFIPFANSVSPDCAAARQALALPQLSRALARMTALLPDEGDALSLSPPHERALASALGLNPSGPHTEGLTDSLADGLIPWAALRARAVQAERGLALNDGVTSVRAEPVEAKPTPAWAFITPCHWLIGTGHVSLSPDTLANLSEAQSRALLGAMQPYFAEDHITLHYDQPTRWLAQSELFRTLPTASLDRAVGRNVQPWLPHHAGLRRLQNEMQMLLYTHPVNDQRAKQGQTVVNSFWLSGSGALPAAWQAPPAQGEPTVMPELRELALREDWRAWAQAWAGLDARVGVALLQAQARGEVCRVTLCGERSAQTWVSQPVSFLAKILSHFGTQPLNNLISSL